VESLYNETVAALAARFEGRSGPCPEIRSAA
jgi:hypothetical protein